MPMEAPSQWANLQGPAPILKALCGTLNAQVCPAHAAIELMLRPSNKSNLKPKIFTRPRQYANLVVACHQEVLFPALTAAVPAVVDRTAALSLPPLALSSSNSPCHLEFPALCRRVSQGLGGGHAPSTL